MIMNDVNRTYFKHVWWEAASCDVTYKYKLPWWSVAGAGVRDGISQWVINLVCHSTQQHVRLYYDAKPERDGDYKIITGEQS